MSYDVKSTSFYSTSLNCQLNIYVEFVVNYYKYIREFVNYFNFVYSKKQLPNSSRDILFIKQTKKQLFFFETFKYIPES